MTQKQEGIKLKEGWSSLRGTHLIFLGVLWAVTLINFGWTTCQACICSNNRPFRSKLRQVCLETIIKDWDFPSSGFLSCNAAAACAGISQSFSHCPFRWHSGRCYRWVMNQLWYLTQESHIFQSFQLQSKEGRTAASTGARETQEGSSLEPLERTWSWQ